MKIRKRLSVLVSAAVLLVGVSFAARAQPQNDAAAVAIGNDDIGGVVTGPHGPEAGVWVIAETTDLPTQFMRIVVTDDQGRYVVPDLPKAELQRLGARLRPGRFAQGAREPGQHLDLEAARRRTTRPPRNIIRRSTGIRC